MDRRLSATCGEAVERDEVETAVRRWLDARSVNPATGQPPDAKLIVTAVPVTAEPA